MWTSIAKILICDENINNLIHLARLLQAGGYQTRLTYHADDFLRLAGKEAPDLILLDFMMSGLTAYVVARHLQNNPLTADTPFIFLSSSTTADSLVDGLELGAADFIVKPFHSQELLARVKHALRMTDQLNILRNENRRLHQLSILDDLTALYNRRYFFQRLAEEVNRAERYHYQLACLMIDIDYFKDINDQYGHLVGDIILKDLAEMIASAIRLVDVAARFGGEEFVVLLPQTNAEGGLAVAEKIRSKIEAQSFSNTEQIALTVSIGISCYEKGTASELSLLHEADLALYDAKKGGRNNCQVYTDLIT